MKKIYEASNTLEHFLKCLLFISIPALSMFFCRNCETWMVYSSFGCAVVISYFIVKYLTKNIYKKINIPITIISFLCSLMILLVYYNYHYDPHFTSYFYHFSKLLFVVICILSLPSVVTIIYLLIKNIFPLIKTFLISLSKGERIFLIILTIVGFISTTIIYNLTTAFYYSPTIHYDIIYTSDSSTLFRGDAFFNINMPENDVRQPLFGLFAFPFAFIAKVLGMILFFIPNSYAIFLTTIQISLLGIITLMISKLAHLNKKQETNFILLYFASFSTIVFSFILEQYIIGLFYLILLIYLYYNSKKEVNYMYIAGPGTLLTSGIMFPFISKFKNLKYWLKNIFKCFLCFLIVMTVFGQLPIIFSISETIGDLLGNFGGKTLLFGDKLMQYLNFVKGIVLMLPASDILTNDFGVSHYAYFLNDIYNYSKLGILILIICLVSVILNRKNKMAIISFLWIIFSFILLCLIGWGTAENGLNLYSLYFSWAFILLIYLFIDKIIKNEVLKRILIIVVCLILLSINIPELIKIVNFGILHYPA